MEKRRREAQDEITRAQRVVSHVTYHVIFSNVHMIFHVTCDVILSKCMPIVAMDLYCVTCDLHVHPLRLRGS